MKFRIGLRTIKTAVSATLAILIATQFHLEYPTAAGIIALLSVSNTKRSSLKLGIYRLLSLTLATCLSLLCFQLLGYNAIAFGIFLLLFIPLAVMGNMSDGIVVSSVLITHYLVVQKFSLAIIVNAYLLMIIGVGLAWLVNLYMPNVEKHLKEDQQKIELSFRKVLREMAEFFVPNAEKGLGNQCDSLIQELEKAIQTGENWARTHAENQMREQNRYYQHYFDMRRIQVQMLKEMLQLLKEIEIEQVSGQAMQELFLYTAQTFAEENDGMKIAEKIACIYRSYQELPLPKTRIEFENRARLYQLLSQFQTFIEIKIGFYYQKKPFKQRKKG